MVATYRHAPLARHEAIAPFSRDHYVGLVQSQHLLAAARGDDVTRRRALAEFIDQWDQHIAEHFDDEERLLGPLMSDADRAELLRQHEQVRQNVDIARRLRREVNPDPDTLHKIGATLEQHIRWEERQLFNRLQQELSAEQLSRLQEGTDELEQRRPRKRPGQKR